MAQSVIKYPVFLTIGEVKLKFQTKDGGRHLTFVEVAELPEGVSKAGFERVFGKLMATARAESAQIVKEEAEAAEARAKAKSDRQAAILAAEAEAQRKARRDRFYEIENTPSKRVKFDPATMWRTRNRSLAIAFVEQNVLPYLGPSGDSSYAFSDEQHIGDNICPRCKTVSLKRSAPNLGGVVHVHCSNATGGKDGLSCGYHNVEHAEPPKPAHSYVRQAMHPLQAR